METFKRLIQFSSHEHNPQNQKYVKPKEIDLKEQEEAKKQSVRSSVLINKHIEEKHLKFSNNFLGTRHMIRWYKNKIRELEGPKLRETMKRRTLSEIRSSSTNTIEDDQWKHSNGSSGSHQLNKTSKIKNTSTKQSIKNKVVINKCH